MLKLLLLSNYLRCVASGVQFWCALLYCPACVTISSTQSCKWPIVGRCEDDRRGIWFAIPSAPCDYFLNARTVMRIPLFLMTACAGRQFPGFLLCALMIAAPALVKAANKNVDYSQVESGVSFAAVQALDYREADHTLVYGSDPLQFGRLWLPAAVDTQPASLVVLIHGGCWMNAYDMAHTFALSTALAQAGYAVWSLEYRRTGDEGGGWPGSYEDVLAGIDYIDLWVAPRPNGLQPTPKPILLCWKCMTPPFYCMAARTLLCR